MFFFLTPTLSKPVCRQAEEREPKLAEGNLFFYKTIAKISELQSEYYLSVTQPVDALDTALAYFKRTPLVAFRGG